MSGEDESWGQEGIDGNEGGYNPEYSGQQNENDVDGGSYVPGDISDNGSDDGGDYDPESVSYDPTSTIAAQEITAAEPQQTSAKPKTTGGFLVEASDDEDDDDEALVPAATIVQTQPQVRPVVEEKPIPTAAPAADPSLSAPAAMMGIDPVAFLEVRVKEDPRGDMDAWLGLIAEYKRQSKIADLRKTYTGFLEVFPQAVSTTRHDPLLRCDMVADFFIFFQGDIWCEWIETELAMDNFVDAERLFGQCLMSVPNVRLWTVYLNYIRRRNDLNNDTTGQARQTVTQSYEFVIDNIGSDRESGGIWQDYIQFIKNGPGQIGGTGWQDQQKMDQLRKAYHRAITVPMSTVNNLWKEYDQFEMALNKVTVSIFSQLPAIEELD